MSQDCLTLQMHFQTQHLKGSLLGGSQDALPLGLKPLTTWPTSDRSSPVHFPPGGATQVHHCYECNCQSISSSAWMWLHLETGSLQSRSTLRGGSGGLEEILICNGYPLRKERTVWRYMVRRCVRTGEETGGRQLQGEEYQEVPDTTRSQEEAERHPLELQKERDLTTAPPTPPPLPARSYAA